MGSAKTSTSVAAMRSELHRLTESGDFEGAFRRLISEGFTVGTAPALWEFLARRSADKGETRIAGDLHRALWEVGVVSADAALTLAEEALEQGDRARAEGILTEAFGSDPDDTRARLCLARSIADHDPDRAVALVDGLALTSADTAILTVDLLRQTDRLQEARGVLAKVRRMFPDDARFLVRMARVHEALSEWQAALEIWNAVVDTGEAERFRARISQLRLLLRLERRDQALNLFRDAMRGEATLDARLQMAALLGLHGLAGACTEAAFLGWRRDPGSVRDWPQACGTLANLGLVGTLAWLKARRVPMSGEQVEIIETALSKERRATIAAMPFAAAAHIQSPQIFLDELSRPRRRGIAAPVGGHPILIVNSTLPPVGPSVSLSCFAMPSSRPVGRLTTLTSGFFA